MENLENVKEELQRVLHNLSSPYDVQVNYLKTLGTYPEMDELALEFDDVFCLLQLEANPYSLSFELIDILKKLDAILDENSGDANRDFWDIEVSGQSEWEIVRRISKEALGHLGMKLFK